MATKQWLHGFLDACLLGLLLKGRDYGLGLTQRLTEAGLGDLPAGSLYPALVRLEADGLVTATREPSPAGPPRKYYELTASGRVAAEDGMTAWATFRGAMDRVLAPAEQPQVGS